MCYQPVVSVTNQVDTILCNAYTRPQSITQADRYVQSKFKQWHLEIS